MKKYRVSFRPRAEADLLSLCNFVAEQSGLSVAGAFVDRIEAACAALERFPERGRRRDDIRAGLRILGFERRATIVFQIRRSDVVIVRIFYRGRDYEPLLRADADE